MIKYICHLEQIKTCPTLIDPLQLELISKIKLPNLYDKLEEAMPEKAIEFKLMVIKDHLKKMDLD